MPSAERARSKGVSRMRQLRLRTQLAIVAVFLAVYSLAIAISYRVEARAHANLERAFRQDLTTLTSLPRIADLLRHEALVSQQYLLTGRKSWLGERARTITEIHKLQQDIDPLLSDDTERRLWAELGRRLDGYLSEQGQWVERRRQGRLMAGSAVELIAPSGPLEGLVSVLVEVRDRNTLALQSRREAALRASQLTFYLTLGAGLLIGTLLVVFVSWYVIGPLTRLEGYARGWRLGDDWTLPAETSGPEIESLFVCLREMSARLNEEYAKERDLARFKSQLVSMVSHEFNNALSIIGGAALVLEDTDGQKTDKRRSYYGMLKANIQALGSAARNLLNMGRLESGRFALTPRRTELAALVRACAQRQELLSLRKQQKVVLELPEGGLDVKADPEGLSLVLANLISNAIKYTPEGGTITVRAGLDETQAGRARVTVRDTGIGIKPADHERVFSGYYRTEQGKSAAPGFGIGLPLAKRILEAHDSVLNLDSDAGKGASFWFTLPVWTEDGSEEGNA